MIFKIKIITKMSESVSLIDKYIEEGQILKTLKDYERTNSQKLFRKIIKQITGSKNSIDGFNNWVLNVLSDQIIDEGFTSKDGIEISFSDVFLSKPVYVIDGKEEILYPAYSRKYRLKYTGKLTAVCTVKKGKDVAKNKIFIGDIPIMLGSIKCNLYNKTVEELVKLGECASDPFGYFITSGEKSLIAHDKIRSNYPLIHKIRKSDLTPQARETYKKNCLERLVLSKKINAIKLVDRKNSPDRDTKHIPIFVAFKIISDLEPEEIINKYFFRFILPENREAARYALSESIFKYQKHTDPYLYLFKKRSYFYKEKYNLNLSKQEIKKLIINDLTDLTYLNYNNITNKELKIEMKVLSLCFLLSKMVLFMINKISLDSKDHWKNKRFENAPILLSTLVSSLFKSTINKVKHDKEKNSKSGDYFTFGELLNSKSSSEFKRWIDKSLNTSVWGINTTGWEVHNHSESTKRDTPLALWSQVIKNTNETSVEGEVVELRYLQPSQRNRHCIAETPEGKQVGIVKYNALTGLFSISSNPEEIIKLANNLGKMYSETYNILLLINGEIIINKKENFTIYVNSDFKNILIKNKRAGNIPLDTEIILNKNQLALQVFTDSSRAICPYLIVNPETRQLVIDEKKGWDASFETLITSGCIEYLSAGEENEPDITISESVDHFYKTQKLIEEENNNEEEEDNNNVKELYNIELKDKGLKKIFTYSHCCIDPLQIYSVSSSTCPFSNHQPSPRTSYQAAMGKQAVGYYNINYHLKFPKEFKRLHKAERSITETDTYFLPKMDFMASGQIANIAFISTATNQEDAITVCEDYINSGNLNLVKYKTFEKCINTSAKSGGITNFVKPECRPNEDPRLYRHLEDNGLPKLDSLIEIGDYILGMVVETPTGLKNESVKAHLDMVGYVDRVEIVREGNGRSPIIRIKLRTNRPYIAGDKLALRYAQKGTIGKIARRDEMPMVMEGINKGMVPDILFNSIGFPKRQTIGLLLEGLLTKAALYDGERVDVSAFRFNNEKILKAKETLRKVGLNEDGNEKMIMSDGKILDNEVFFVPLYEQALRHHVLDKIQFRNTGERDFRTHQPQGGRARGSGLKIGEMEKDAFVAHGASNIIQERLMKSSDEFKLIVCVNCRSIIDSKVCKVCDNSQPGILLIPYVFKVFIHLLMGINMDIRLKTEKVKLF
jgi:DNA-directed RNA polymerase beta subunit